MIHYLDTSVLVKRYVVEPGSAAVRRVIRGRKVATARIAYAELAGALARLCREGTLEESARDRIYAPLDADFSALTVVEIRTSVLQRLPDLVRQRPLRGYDAVHLAAALTLRDGGVPLTFWAADLGLSAAAHEQGLRVVSLVS